MFNILFGLVFIILAANFDKFSKKINKEYLFENRKFYYPISFVLNFIGFTLIFGIYGLIISVLILVAMVSFDKYIAKK